MSYVWFSTRTRLPVKELVSFSSILPFPEFSTTTSPFSAITFAAILTPSVALLELDIKTLRFKAVIFTFPIFIPPLSFVTIKLSEIISLLIVIPWLPTFCINTSPPEIVPFAMMPPSTFWEGLLIRFTSRTMKSP